MLKDAHTGGSFVWHQDYGYWYQNGILLPEMGTVWMPLDKFVTLLFDFMIMNKNLRINVNNYIGIMTTLIRNYFNRCVKENGCLRFLKGSHKMGRIEHVLSGEQAGADMERVNHAMKRFPLIHMEMDPGDVVFFHCNLLHSR